MAALFNPIYGRIGRLHWWLAQIAVFALTIAGLVANIFLFTDWDASSGSRTSVEQTGFVLIVILMIYMNLSTCLNRLRDSGRSGFWYLSFLLPTVGTGLMIYFCGIERGRSSTTGPTSPVAPAGYPPRPQVRQSAFVPKQTRSFGKRNAV